MKRILYFLPVCLVCLFSFKPLESGHANPNKFIIVTGCFEEGEAYVEVDYNTGTSSITQIRIYDLSRTYEWTYVDHSGTASYSGGHVHVSVGFTVYYSGGGGSPAYPPSTTLDNDC
jgi:hypothetical protein